MPRTLASRRPPLPEGFDPLRAIELTTGFRDQVPDIIEFVVSDKYLNRPYLYPRQATLLKVMFLQKGLLTDYDYEVIGQWEESFRRTADEKGIGNNGIVPEVLARMDLCIAEGRPWFRETLNVSGRRGGKGHIGGIAGSYVLWNYLSLGDPQGHFGVDRDKNMAFYVFAGKKEQARANLWKDLANVILGGNCFAPYISRALGEALTIYAPHDFERMFDEWVRGVNTEQDRATFVIEPKESTLLASRGPALFGMGFDEMAHVVATGAVRSAQEVYESAVPALDQFKNWGFIYEPSSPWQKIGQFFDNYQHALEIEDGKPVYPEMLMVQLTSWDIYQDWQIAHHLELSPGSAKFAPLRGAIQEYDEPMRRLERANPQSFAVERRAHWAAVIDAYLDEDKVKEIWKPYGERIFTTQTDGRLDFTYRAHGDPSSVGAGFGYAVGHVEFFPEDERGLPHVVFDLIRRWEPANYPDHIIDYDSVAEEIETDLDAFMPVLSFDQFNSVGTIQRLNKYIASHHRPKRAQVFERPATAPLNWKTAETFKSALNMGLVHAPYHEMTDLELRFLQNLGGKVDHPTTGPVQTKDNADAMMIVVYELIGAAVTNYLSGLLSGVQMGGSQAGGFSPYSQVQAPEQALQELSGFGRSRRPAAGYGNNGGRGRRR